MFWFLVVIASIVAEHYTANILEKGNQFNTKVDYFLGIDRDWRECKDQQLWVEIGSFESCCNRRYFALSIIYPIFFACGMQNVTVRP